MATVSVLNADAGIDAKTLINLEDAQTVTGLKTFDRDPNAPFGVTASSAVVTNLDADKVDGLNAGAMTTYVPTWSGAGGAPVLGNGELSGRYFRIGEWIFFDIILSMGTTTTFGSGSWSFSLPVTALDTNWGASSLLFDTSVNTFYVGMAYPTTTSALFVAYHAATAESISPTLPFTWASGDNLRISGNYRAASAV